CATPRCAAAQPAATASASPTAAAAALLVRGAFLAVQNGALFFTGGQALKLAPGVVVPHGIVLGSAIVVTVAPASGLVTAVARALGPGDPAEIGPEQLPRALLARSPAGIAQATPGPSRAAGIAADIEIEVRVPDNTPVGDDVYLSTDRSSFAAAEIRMSQVDAHDWSVSLRLPAGSTLTYQFTRGTNASVERDALGGIVTPRRIAVESGAVVHDVVARWADLV
ncbi:MAG: hypothetical protein ACREQ5_28525, partial [Candidatus Dormibacteria bacterium]